MCCNPSGSRTPVCPCVGVIKKKKHPSCNLVVLSSASCASVQNISVLSGSSHRFTVHHHIFRRPWDENCFICSDTHLLCHSLQVQLSDPVIQTVLENTSSVLLLLQRSLHGEDLKRRHFSPDFQTNWARLCRMCVDVKW